MRTVFELGIGAKKSRRFRTAAEISTEAQIHADEATRTELGSLCFRSRGHEGPRHDNDLRKTFGVPGHKVML